MRQHGRANISQIYPRALAICDRCGFRYNHVDLSFQYQWRGTKLQNIRILVCQPCLDTPQEQLRVIVLPMDPVPIANARPENYVDADNPMSALGYSAISETISPISQTVGSRIGNLTEGGGLNAAMDGNAYKPSQQSASISIPNSSYNNYVGINWSGANAAMLGAPAALLPPVLRHSLTSYTIAAPENVGIGSTSFLVQGSYSNTSLYGAWDTLASGTLANTPGEVITGTAGGPLYQFHRVAFSQIPPTSVSSMTVTGAGDFNNDFNNDFNTVTTVTRTITTYYPISVAQVSFNVAQIGGNR